MINIIDKFRETSFGLLKTFAQIYDTLFGTFIIVMKMPLIL